VVRKGTRVGWASEAISQGCDGVVSQQAGRVSWVIPAAIGWQQQEVVPRQGITKAAAACPVRDRMSTMTINHGMRLRNVAMNQYLNENNSY